MGPLIIGIIAAIIIGAIVAGVIQARRRRQDMENWARKNSWRFHGSHKDYGLHQRFGFDCLNRGEGDRYAYNIVEGHDDSREVFAFDYHYATYSHSKNGRNKHSHYFSAVVMNSQLPLKPLKIRRENLLDKVANFFGRNTINFESAEFSKKFHVEAPDRRWAYDILHSRVIETLLHAPAFEIQIQGPYLIAASDRQMPIPKFRKALRLLHHLIDSLPDYVRQDLQQRTTAHLPHEPR